MRAVVCVPWRGGDPVREYLWDKVRTRLDTLPWPWFAGDSDPTLPFNRSAARNAAVDAAGPADVYLFVDADTFIPEDQMAEAIYRSYAGDSATLTQTRFLSMDPETGQTVERAATGGANFIICGNIAIAAGAFERLGGWDERLSSWGWEDGALCRLAIHLADLSLVEGTVVSFEHPRTADEDWRVVLPKGRPAALAEYAEAETPEGARLVAANVAKARGRLGA